MNITREIAAKVLKIVDAGLVSGVGKPEPGQMCVEAAVCFALGEPHGDEPSCVDPALRALKITLNDAPWSSSQARAAGLRRLALVQLGSKDALDAVEFAKRVALMTVNKIVPRALRIAASMKLPVKHSKALEKAALQCERAENLGAASDASVAASGAARAASYAASGAARAASGASYAASYAASAASGAASAASDASYAASGAARAASYAASGAASAASVAASGASDKELSEAAEAVVQVLIAMNAPGAQWLDLAPVTEAA